MASFSLYSLAVLLLTAAASALPQPPYPLSGTGVSTGVSPTGSGVLTGIFSTASTAVFVDASKHKRSLFNGTRPSGTSLPSGVPTAFPSGIPASILSDIEAGIVPISIPASISSLIAEGALPTLPAGASVNTRNMRRQFPNATPVVSSILTSIPTFVSAVPPAGAPGNPAFGSGAMSFPTTFTTAPASIFARQLQSFATSSGLPMLSTSSTNISTSFSTSLPTAV